MHHRHNGAEWLRFSHRSTGSLAPWPSGCVGRRPLHLCAPVGAERFGPLHRNL